MPYSENNPLHFPLHMGERMKVRGKPSGGISTLTPTLSRQRERVVYGIFPAIGGIRA